VRIITWNVNGVRARERDVLELVAKHAPDVLCMQEIKSSPDQLPPGLGGLIGLPDYASRWHGEGGYSGVSIHLRRSTFTDPKFSHPSFDLEHRVVEASANGIRFVSMYLPNGGKDFPAKMKFLRELASWAHAVERPVILCGDLNVARAEIDVHPSERNARTIGQRADERELFEKFFAEGFVDLGRKLAPDDDGLFTWWPYWNEQRQRNVGWRLDYVCATDPLAGKARRAQVLRDFGGSDHAPVVLDFD
jgi:exodeoxyribonuclease-3